MLKNNFRDHFLLFVNLFVTRFQRDKSKIKVQYNNISDSVMLLCESFDKQFTGVLM